MRSRSSAKSLAIHSSTSDSHQPTALPRNRALLGNRPINASPTSSHRGRRVRRATSCALRRSVSGGYGSLIQRESVTCGAALGSAVPNRTESSCIESVLSVSNPTWHKAQRTHPSKQRGELGAMQCKPGLSRRHRRSSTREVTDTWRRRKHRLST
jgi:hypothetical protein